MYAYRLPPAGSFRKPIAPAGVRRPAVFRRRTPPPPFRRRFLPRAALLALVLAATAGSFAALYGRPTPGPPPAPAAENAGKASAPARRLAKQELPTLLAARNFLNATDSRLTLPGPNGCLTVQTTIDHGLQDYLVHHLDLRHSRYIGIVVMDPTDGRILAMAGHDRTDPRSNPCLESRFPAASIFKIITAAAAVEICDLAPESTLLFEGGKHTLYRAQIEDRRPRWANRITLKDSFAQSVNPVFGKLGVHALGREVIESYAQAFGFNREIDFELPIRPSAIELTDAPYELAEVASGFNRTTRISPLHGALMAAAIVNGGRLVSPALVDWIADESGRTLYQREIASGERAVDPPTSAVLRELMRATVQSGTARREFVKHHDDRILSRLEIGGKTGSMGDGASAMRYDWFVGYAVDHRSSERIVFSVVVAHEEYIGTRAAAYAAMAIKEYFRLQYARQEEIDGGSRDRG